MRTMDDLISRQAAIDLIADYDLSMGQVVRGIHALPSAQPEQKWIPCSERLPKSPIRVQIQLDNGWIITGFYDEGYWYSVPDCGDALNGDVIQMSVLAWRELPEQYKRGEEDV